MFKYFYIKTSVIVFKHTLGRCSWVSVLEKQETIAQYLQSTMCFGYEFGSEKYSLDSEPKIHLLGLKPLQYSYYIEYYLVLVSISNIYYSKLCNINMFIMRSHFCCCHNVYSCRSLPRVLHLQFT